jgi:hypothetical protein
MSFKSHPVIYNKLRITQEVHTVHNNVLKITSTTCILVMFILINLFAQDQSPVRILFDKNAKRIDIMTGKQIPNYTQAQRGSFQFFNGRLDKPENGFWYYYDGRFFQSIDTVAFIRNIKQLGCWIIALKDPNGKIPNEHPEIWREIEHHAISFIPLNPTTKKPESRVYVLLENMHLIQWADYDNRLAIESQEEIECGSGVIY